MTKKQLTRTLLSFGLCGSLLMACTKKENADAEKAELRSATELQKSERAQYEDMNADLQLQIAAINQREEELAKLRNSLDEAMAQHSSEMHAREASLLGLTAQIETATKNLGAANGELAQINDQIVIKTQELEKTRANNAAERAALEANIAQVKAQIAEDIAKAKADSDKITSDAQADADKARSDADAEIASKRSKLEKDLAALEARLSAVADREEKASKKETLLAETKSDLEKAQANLDAQEAAHIAKVKDFSEKVAAARDFFIKNNKGDVFEKIEANSTFAFRVSLWGFGSVENIKTIRAMVKAHNKTKGLKKDNKNVEHYPVMIKATDEEILKQEEMKDKIRVAAKKIDESLIDLFEKYFVYDTEKDVTFINDSFMVTGTATDVKKFRDDTNKLLSKMGESGNPNASNMWLIARPVQEVKVNMVIKVSGSSDMTHDRSQSEILKMDKIRPIKSDIVNTLNNIDINKPSQYVLSAKAAASCETVGAECIKEIKNLGLLDYITEVTYTNEAGISVKEKISYGEYLIRLIEVSVKKLRLQGAIINAYENGVVRTESRSYRTVLTKPWTLDRLLNGRTKDIAIESSADDAEAEINRLLADQDLLDDLASQKIIEKIEISYEVNMVDTINGAGDSLDMTQYLTAGKFGNTNLESAELKKRGEVEIPLPLRSTEKSSSQLTDLSLSDLKANLVEPVKPDAPKVTSDTTSNMVLHVLSMQDRMDIMRSLRESGSYDVSQLEASKRDVAREYIKSAKNQIAYDNHGQAMRKYRSEMEVYNQKLEAIKTSEYNNRSLELMVRLKDFLKVLKK